jgi:L-amino acid N-acyltransferase YncA
MKFTIKVIEKEDIKATSEWFNKLVDEKPGIVENFKVDPKDNPFLEEQVDLVKKGKMITLIMKVEGKVVSKIDVKPLPRNVDKHVGEVSFGALKGYDKESEELVKMAIEKVKSLGLKVLIYYIFDTNKRFISIMEKAGFKKVGKIDNFYKIDNKYIDRIIFQKQIL